MKIQQYVRWLFWDAVKTEGQPFSYVEMQPYGDKGMVMIFLGEDQNGNCGDFQLFPSAILNLKDIIKVLGDDDEKWKSKIFLFTPNKDKRKFSVKLLN